MIIDKVENMSNYKDIPSYVVDFVKGLNRNVDCGRYSLVGDDYANIETYQTKLVSDARFEAHKNYIDIQILMSGKERIYYKSIDGLVISEPYDEVRDIEFYSDDISNSDFVTLDGTNFMMIYPHEAHAPQVALNKSVEFVKKVVIKVKV